MNTIKKIFELFVSAMEKDNFSFCRRFMKTDVCGRFSTIGGFSGIDELLDKLRWRGEPYEDHVIRITNFAVHYDENKAQQSAYIQGQISKEEQEFLHAFLYGGHFAVSYERDGENWKISEIRFDMDYVSGNTDFVKGKWSLINYQFFMGQKLTSSVIGELDSPWIRCPGQTGLSEEEKIMDTSYHYAFAMDTADFTSLMTTYDDEVHAVMPHGTFQGKRDFTAYFKYVRLKEPTFSHAVVVKDIVIKGDMAEVTLYRTEPHRIGTKVLTCINRYHVFFSAIYHNKFKKVGDEWIISEIRYEQKGFSVDVPKEIHYINDYCYEMIE